MIPPRAETRAKGQSPVVAVLRAVGRHSATMSRLPREARDGLMRVWLEILRERHPGTSWIVEVSPSEDEPPTDAQSERSELVSAV
jgi:hypothetical protein